ncbi:major tail tube protein [Caulobacter phage CcrBL10]|uniref:Major tail tube protein n=1 Tax=Caulobacter phage CcrBL10 TaxID=2283269 RepID=A0A385EC64_9CAUD|nr:major tail tube protein [Caulobacter phage CcrBL10]AXQ68289.1 major tail tube protein [Caulobacter phage CcrBL10]
MQVTNPGFCDKRKGSERADPALHRKCGEPTLDFAECQDSRL